jgi:hypothetical protein
MTAELIVAIVFGIVNLIAMIVAITVAFSKLGARLDVLNVKVTSVTHDVSDLKTTDRRLAVIEERQNNQSSMIVNAQKDVQELRGEVSDLRKGHGWIVQTDGG